MQANAQASVMKQQAAVEEQRAEIEAQNAETRAKEETASGQRDAAQRMREARLAQSRLKATSGASGSSSSDATVLDIFEDIGAEGRYNADADLAYADQRATGIRNQSRLDTWSAHQSARNLRSQARMTKTGGYLNALGTGLSGGSRMVNRYGGYSSRRTYG